MPLYFACGSNMCVEAMSSRCPRSKPLGLARLERHRLSVMREGWLTVTRDSRSAVHGVLWELALADVPALDRYEGLARGVYVKVEQPVILKGGPKRALVYVGANAGPGVTPLDYIERVLAGARAWPLPPAAISALEEMRQAAIQGRR
jgi:hypothetical protein